VTHPRFWRRAVESLWRESIQFGHGIPPPQSTSSLSSTAFTHIALRWRAYDPEDVAFWLGFFHGTRACDATLSSVLETLNPYLAAESRFMAPLQVSLSHCHTYGRNRGRYDDWLTQYRVGSRRVVDPEVVQTILRAALDAKKKHRSWSQASRAWTTVRLGLVFEYRIDDDPSTTREMLDLVARAQTLKRSPRLPIGRHFSIQLAPPYGPRRSGPHARDRKAFVTRGRALGQLLRSLLLASAMAVETVALLNGSYSDYRLVGAALSAVALASPPVSALRCSGLLDPSRAARVAGICIALSTSPSRAVSTGVARNGYPRAPTGQ
jgi:hypothetical protein